MNVARKYIYIQEQDEKAMLWYSLIDAIISNKIIAQLSKEEFIRNSNLQKSVDWD